MKTSRLPGFWSRVFKRSLELKKLKNLKAEDAHKLAINQVSEEMEREIGFQQLDFGTVS